jgi:hypothetical protein
MVKRGRSIAFITIVTAFAVISGPPVYAQNAQKSAAKAFFYSLLIPGLGHKYVDNIGNARYFIAADIVLFGFGIGHDIYSNVLEDDYRAFGASHAGFVQEGKNKEYIIAVSRYNSIFDYNKAMRLNRDFDLVFPETTGTAWIWDSSANREQFLDRRIDSDDIRNRRTFFYSGMFLNHILSGLHAAFKAKRYNDNAQKTNWNLQFRSMAHPINPSHFIDITYKF